MTYRELLAKGASLLQKAGIEEYELDAWYLMEYAAGISRTQYFLKQCEETHGEEAAYLEAIGKRSKRIPLQYITGVQEFMGIPFFVNEDVLIPRQDTETLVEFLMKNLPENARVLDMCTGSGCIAISLGKLMGAEVTAVDLSQKALLTARKNAENLHVPVTFYESDLFATVPEEKYDVIVSNPPYIPTEVIKGLQPEVRDFEPHMALDGEADGLTFYRRIVDESRVFLKNGGLLAFEIGHDQREAVTGLMEEAGFTKVGALKDMAGLDRVVYGTWF